MSFRKKGQSNSWPLVRHPLFEKGEITIATQLKLVFFVLLSFLVLLSFHLWTNLKDQSKILQQVEQDRLNQASLLLLREIHQHSLEGKTLAPVLKQWVAQFSVDRLTVLDSQGNDIAQVSNFSDPTTPRSYLSAEDRAQVLKGYSLTLHTEGNGHWNMYLPIRKGEDPVSGILQIENQETRFRVPDSSTATSLLLKLFGVAGATVLGYSFIRTGVLSWRKQRQSPEDIILPNEIKKEIHFKRDQNDFVLDTFQSVVHELKEKEQELERLRNAAEEKVRDIESYNENILRSVSSGVITFNPNREITTFNSAAEKILGIPSDQMVGFSCEGAFGPNSPVYQLLERALKDEQPTARQEFEMQWPDQRKIWVGVSTSLLRDQRERIIGATCVFTDLTEIRRLQEQVELKKRLTVLGEMSAGIAHEFRNFMGTILGFAKLLSKQVDPHDPMQSMIDAIIQELRAMEHLISELLNFSKNTDINCQALALKPFLENVMNKVPKREDEKPWEIVMEIPENLPPIYGDEILLRQAFSNLANNGIDAMENGGVLRVAAYLIPHSTVEITIQDSGKGIPPEDLEKIFLPFFTTKEKGTGMGLALVHKIILSHNGRIEAKSEEGKGSTFHIYIPTWGTLSETCGDRKKGEECGG
ncbi:MAG TPA: ATP-binding protein [Nitrospiria bacterium]|jgi:PAS domain S-box-containing protein